ncbi:protein kinase [Capsaspora owczarzaki ATCC 30864]|uniref:Protein kinase n=1 Tax=Capsaspora owczarzaki (strain ATCC 30864) TaxID=595528 RepID=A0A0D2WK58_CAPO3|nr:protein kinase [Capsaspora owczarzaki ATCC 30864]KJE89943.1 protein kinase [Capsaspora owczarzaki ATCC 30864]|eukprot:XP_004349861.2 protein kinase [Capsaspora owczarzaki ATCC 30864]
MQAMEDDLSSYAMPMAVDDHHRHNSSSSSSRHHQQQGTAPAASSSSSFVAGGAPGAPGGAGGATGGGFITHQPRASASSALGAPQQQQQPHSNQHFHLNNAMAAGALAGGGANVAAASAPSSSSSASVSSSMLTAPLASAAGAAATPNAAGGGNNPASAHFASAGTPSTPGGGPSSAVSAGASPAGSRPASSAPAIHDPAGILEGRKLYTAIMKQHTCYDLVPDSGKIIVFEVNLLVRKAFYALLQNGLRSAPIWDSSRQQFVGMLTVTDFINILRFYYKSPLVTMDEVEEHRIQTWREVVSTKLPAKMISVEPMATLYDAARILVMSRIHRLPLIDSASNSAVAVLTHKRILHFMYNSMKQTSPPAFLSHSIGQLNIGTYKNIATASPDTPLIIVLNVFAEKRVSCLPIVDETGVVIDVYAKYDVINLARERTYNNLDVPVLEALSHRAEGFEGVVTCLKTDSFKSILDSIVCTHVHRLIVVDNNKRVIGIVSLSDILTFLML